MDMAKHTLDMVVGEDEQRYIEAFRMAWRQVDQNIGAIEGEPESACHGLKVCRRQDII
jgi:hypothetical protein